MTQTLSSKILLGNSKPRVFTKFNKSLAIISVALGLGLIGKVALADSIYTQTSKEYHRTYATQTTTEPTTQQTNQVNAKSNIKSTSQSTPNSSTNYNNYNQTTNPNSTPTYNSFDNKDYGVNNGNVDANSVVNSNNTSQVTSFGQVTNTVVSPNLYPQGYTDFGMSFSLGYKWYQNSLANDLFSGLLLTYDLLDMQYYFPALPNNMTFTTGLQIKLESYGSSYNDNNNDNNYHYDNDNENNDFSSGLNFKPVFTIGLGSYRPTIGTLDLLFGIGAGIGYYSSSFNYRNVSYYYDYNYSYRNYGNFYFRDYTSSSEYITFYKTTNIISSELSFYHSLITAQLSIGFHINNFAMGIKYSWEQEHIYSATLNARFNSYTQDYNFNLDENFINQSISMYFRFFM